MRAARRPNRRLLLGPFLVLARLGAACASPGYLARQQFTPAPVDESTVVTGPLRWLYQTGDEWLRVRVSNSGDAPVVLSWDAVQWVTPDGVVHRVVEASRVRDFMAVHRVALAVEARLPLTAAEEAMLFSWRLANALEHRAPPGLGRSEPSRLGSGETGEWVLYPAEHIVVSASGDVLVEPLFGEHAFASDDPLRPSFALLVPVRIDGRSTTITASPRAEGGSR